MPKCPWLNFLFFFVFFLGGRGGGGAGGVVGGWVEVFIIFLKCSHFCELCVF